MMGSLLPVLKKKAPWLFQEGIRPYVYMRPENRVTFYGRLHDLDWFSHLSILEYNPLSRDHLKFGYQIIKLENLSFGPLLAMPKWVFYDCAVLPGLVCGFAIHQDLADQELIRLLDIDEEGLVSQDWIPLSLFISIPTLSPGEWVAHNLCAINSLLPKEKQFYALGFLTKAFGLWYGNVELCVGMTQWPKAALKLHSHYGYLEVLTAYTPLHTHVDTMTYRCSVDTRVWRVFFTREEDQEFYQNFVRFPKKLDPKSLDSMREIQIILESGRRLYLNPQQIARKNLLDPYELYLRKTE